MANQLLNPKRKRQGAKGTFPVPRDFSPEGKRFAQHIIDNIQQLTGEKGNVLDKAVTFNDLIAAGLAKKNTVAVSSGSAGAGFLGTVDQGVDSASIPTGVTATGAFQNILVTFNRPLYAGHSHTEIWINSTDDFANKVFLGQTSSTVFNHQVGNGVTRYYWVRHVNKNGVAGSFQDDNGVVANTATIGTTDISDLAVTSAKIQNLAVDKLTGSFATFASTVTGNLDVTNLTGTFANLENVITGELSADSIKIDNVTIDTDGNGNLIIKSNGVDQGQLATKAAGAFKTFARGSVTIGASGEGGSYVEVISFGTTGGGNQSAFIAGEAGVYSAFYSGNLADPNENISGDDGADILMQIYSNTNSTMNTSKTMRLYAERGMGFTVATVFTAAKNESFQVRVFVKENNGLTANAFVDNNFLQVMRITKGQ